MCGAAERLRPVCSEALDMLRVEAVAEGMADHVVGHYPMMPSLGKTAQTTDSTRRLKDSTHIRMITKRPTRQPCRCSAANHSPRISAVISEFASTRRRPAVHVVIK